MTQRQAMRCFKAIVAILGLLTPVRYAIAQASLAYEIVEPSRIKLGDSAIIRVTSFGTHLKDVDLPVVPGLTFEMLGRSIGAEFVNGTAVPAIIIRIRITPQFVGDFTIPALLPSSRPMGLQVVSGNEPNPFAYPSQTPAPLPVAPVSLPKDLQLQAGRAAFLQLLTPKRAVYVGESFPVEIALGIKPGIVTSVGLPTLDGSDFTLDNLSKNPKTRDQTIEGSPWQIWTWHSVVAAIKPGGLPLAVDAPLMAKVDNLSADDTAFASRLIWPFLQIMYNSIKPRAITITSSASNLKVLPLPTEGQPKDFSGAVGTFQVTSDVSPAQAAVGEPLTLRLHVSGEGNFDRVDATMLDHLDQWKTYPAKSSFTRSDQVGYRGEKVFEQPLIAAKPGEQTIPALEFSYFNPNTRQYERALTSPIQVTIGASSSAVAAAALAGSVNPGLFPGLRPDHSQLRGAVSNLRPLYFQPAFLAVPATLVLILAGGWLLVRPNAVRATSKATEGLLARLDEALQAGNASLFLLLARQALQQTFAARWQISPDQITPAILKNRLGASSDDIEQLFALADEAKYSDFHPADADLQSWLKLVRNQLTGGDE